MSSSNLGGVFAEGEVPGGCWRDWRRLRTRTEVEEVGEWNRVRTSGVLFYCGFSGDGLV